MSSLPPFLEKLQVIAFNSDPTIASWSDDGKEFVVRSDKFEADVLSHHFKGSLKTFIRQLHFYCFKKSENVGEQWSFSHPKFLRDDPDSIYEIKRKTRMATTAFASKHEILSMKNDLNQFKTSLKLELEELKAQVSLIFKLLNQRDSNGHNTSSSGSSVCSTPPISKTTPQVCKKTKNYAQDDDDLDSVYNDDDEEKEEVRDTLFGNNKMNCSTNQQYPLSTLQPFQYYQMPPYQLQSTHANHQYPSMYYPQSFSFPPPPAHAAMYQKQLQNQQYSNTVQDKTEGQNVSTKAKNMKSKFKGNRTTVTKGNINIEIDQLVQKKRKFVSSGKTETESCFKDFNSSDGLMLDDLCFIGDNTLETRGINKRKTTPNGYSTDGLQLPFDDISMNMFSCTSEPEYSNNSKLSTTTINNK